MMNLPEFSLIGRVDDCDPELGCVRTVQCMPGADEYPLSHHFPGFPVMPGVLLTEIMAQSCGLLVYARSGGSRFGILAGIDRARFKRFVGPESVVACEAALRDERSGFLVFESRLVVGGKRVAKATLQLGTLPLKSRAVASSLEAKWVSREVP